MATSTMRYNTLETVVVRVSEANAVVAACAEGPEGFTSLIDFGLGFDPFEEGRPFAVWRAGVAGVGGGVSCSGNFEDYNCDVFVGEAFDPDGEFGAVAVEACEDYDEGNGFGGATSWWEVVVKGDLFAFGGEAVGVRDGDLLGRAVAES